MKANLWGIFLIGDEPPLGTWPWDEKARRVNHREPVMTSISFWSLFCFLLPGSCLTSLHGGQGAITWNKFFPPHVAVLSRHQANKLEYSATGNFRIERPGEMWMMSRVWHMASWRSLKYLLEFQRNYITFYQFGKSQGPFHLGRKELPGSHKQSQNFCYTKLWRQVEGKYQQHLLIRGGDSFSNIQDATSIFKHQPIVQIFKYTQYSTRIRILVKRLPASYPHTIIFIILILRDSTFSSRKETLFIHIWAILGS